MGSRRWQMRSASIWTKAEAAASWCDGIARKHCSTSHGRARQRPEAPGFSTAGWLGTQHRSWPSMLQCRRKGELGPRGLAPQERFSGLSSNVRGLRWLHFQKGPIIFRHCLRGQHCSTQCLWEPRVSSRHGSSNNQAQSRPGKRFPLPHKSMPLRLRRKISRQCFACHSKWVILLLISNDGSISFLQWEGAVCPMRIYTIQNTNKPHWQ